MRKKLFVLCVIAIAVALLLTACAGVDLTLTFEVDGEVYATVNTMGQETVKMPKDPEKEGYAFDGWYWDKDVWEKPFTANSLLESPLSSNMTVYAKWKLESETHEHSFGEWKVVTPATCNEEGIQKRKCSVCEEEETAAIPKLAHTYEIKYDTANHWEECSVCQEKVNITAHTFGKWTVVTPATCTAEGLKKRVCSVCGEEETGVITKLAHNYETKFDAENHWQECSVGHEKINVTAHSFGKWEAITPATCTAQGQQKHVCSCGAEQTEAIPKLEHNYETKFDAENHWQECSVGHEKINVTAHTFGKWEAITPATCTAEGFQKHVCSCGAEETEVIPILAHRYEVKYDETNHWQVCSVCGETTNKSAHTYENGLCTVCEIVYGTQGLKYQKITNGYSVSGIGSAGSNAKIEIPSLYKGEPVTEIGRDAFRTCNFTAIAIPDSVTSIGDYAFSGCSSLTSIAIGNSVTSIGNSAFSWCSRLTSIAIPNSVTSIGAHAFNKCSSLTGIAIPDRVTSIGDAAFSYCGSLETITVAEGNTKYHSAGNCLIETETKTLIAGCKNSVIPTDGSVTSIGSYAFSGCTGLQSIAIPDSVTSIGDKAFYECSSLTSIAIPDSVTSIGDYAFYDCSSLTSIAIPNSVTSIGDKAFYECGSLTSIVIPDSVTSIGNSAFSGCSSLASITIPNSVTSIGTYAFYGCSSLTSIAIPNSVTSIGYAAFEGCRSLTSITIPDSVTSIGYDAFSGCSSFETITVAEGNTKYHSAGNCLIETATKTLIAGCKNSIIPTDGSVTSIGTQAFHGCSSLTSIAIPNSVTSIDSSSFEGCNSLTSITIPFVGATKDGASDTHFGYIFGASSYSNNETYVPSSLKEVIITGGTSIGANAFDGCSSLTSITIPDSVTSIGSSAFSGCSRLTSIAIPDSVTSIGDWAFSGCSNLTSITIGNGVTSIGKGAFKGCSSLQSITIPFVGATKDGTSDTHFGYIFGASRYSDNETLVPSSLKEVIITGGTSIGSSAFSGCSGLTSIAIPNSVTSIGSSAFSGCSGLTSIAIPNSVTSIGNGAFGGCSNLTSIEIGNGITSIGYGAFGYCSSLETITVAEGNTKYHSAGNCIIETATKTLIAGCKNSVIPNDGSVTSIGSSAFYRCSSLTSIAIPDSVTSIGRYAFQYSSLTSITIPFVGATKDGTSNTHFGYIFGASSSNYNDDYVPNSLKEVIITGGTNIGSYAFQDCSRLTSIEIPNSVTSIGGWAFEGCSSLTKVEMNDIAAWCGIEFGNSYANPLYYANHLYINGVEVTELAIPDSVTSIGSYAFSGYSSLTSITIPDSVTSIGYEAFYKCSSLTSIAIPDSVTYIGFDAFKYCSSLTSITIPADSVTSIGSEAFSGCSRLTSITIGNGVTRIDYQAFSGCSSLTNIEYQGTKAEWKAITKGSNWNDNTGNYTVKCTDGTLTKAQS